MCSPIGMTRGFLTCCKVLLETSSNGSLSIFSCCVKSTHFNAPFDRHESTVVEKQVDTFDKSVARSEPEGGNTTSVKMINI